MTHDADFDELLRAQRLREAAELMAARGDHAQAATLLERDCRFGEASDEALRAGDGERALVLACQGEDDARAERALAVVDVAARARVATTLAARRHFAWAARTFELAGALRDAAAAWSEAQREDRAAELRERMGDAAGAARELEAALRREPSRAPLRLQLGRLLARHGRLEAAVRALQAISLDAAERPAALAELAPLFDQLGLAAAARECRAELAERGAAEPESPGTAPTAAPDRSLFYGRYERLADVASTANARVLRCRDVLTDDEVALKIFVGSARGAVGRDALGRFEREVAILRALRHANIVPLRDYLPEGPALVLTWMAGGSLKDMLAKETLAPARAIEITTALLDALAEAHRAGIIHRDVKPANVLFDAFGTARLSDFGAAHFGDLAATATAGVIGTFAYMSPEQRLGRPATIRSDLYSVGLVLLEMLGGSVSAGDGAPILPSALHRDLRGAHDEVIAALIATAPEDRPADAPSARRALLALPWAATIERALSERRPADAAVGGAPRARLRADGDAFVDEWTGRRVRVLPLTPSLLARARAYAQADAVETVLRIDARTSELWVEVADGPPLTGPLTPHDERRLRHALATLHEGGVAHGRVDAAHVRMTGHGATLSFEPEASPTATPDLDRLALAQLAARD